jgi:parallel beta-helix repeat protein
LRKSIFVGILAIFVIFNLFSSVSSSPFIEKINFYSAFQNEGSLCGYIKDSLGNKIIGAKITITCSNIRFECFSNHYGYYFQGDIPIVDCYWNVTVFSFGYQIAYVEMAIDENSIHNFVIYPNHIIYVDDDNIKGPWNGSQEFPYNRIQDAVDNANDADTIFVFGGTYYENIILDKSLNLIGEDKKTTIIDGKKLNNTLNLVSQGITVSGFSVTNGINALKKEVDNWFFAGIRVTGSRNKIIDNIVYNNTLGIFCKQATNLTICHNTFYNDGINIYPYDVEKIRPPILREYFVHDIFNNTINGKPLLYYLDISNFEIPSDFGQLIAVNCKNLEIKNANVEQSDFVVMLVFCSECIIEKCKFDFNDGAFTLLSSHDNLFRYNTFMRSFHGLLLDYASKFNTIEYNIFSKNKHCGIMIEYFSNFNVIRKNNFYQNSSGAFFDLRNMYQAYFLDSFYQSWSENFWGRIKLLPKIIFGNISYDCEGIFLEGTLSITFVNIDWHPAKKPYDL